MNIYDFHPITIFIIGTVHEHKKNCSVMSETNDILYKGKLCYA